MSAVDAYLTVPDYYSALHDYDYGAAQYYDLRNVRRRIGSFPTHVVRKISTGR
ncbi:MAG: hypothetical protein ABF811_04110 [Pseudoclavibacter sp.]